MFVQCYLFCSKSGSLHSFMSFYIVRVESTVCWRGGGSEKVLISKCFLHFSGQSDGGEWWSNDCPYFFNILGSIYGQKVPFLAPNCHKLGKSGHSRPWRPQMAGSRWIKVGSSQVTPGPMCLDLFSFPTLPSGPQNSQFCPQVQFMTIISHGGHFGLFQSPPMALPDGFKGSNTSVWMYPTQIQPRSRQYHQFGASKDDYIQQYPFWPIWGPPEALQGPPRPPKVVPAAKKCGHFAQAS